MLLSVSYKICNNFCDVFVRHGEKIKAERRLLNPMSGLGGIIFNQWFCYTLTTQAVTTDEPLLFDNFYYNCWKLISAFTVLLSNELKIINQLKVVNNVRRKSSQPHLYIRLLRSYRWCRCKLLFYLRFRAFLVIGSFFVWVTCHYAQFLPYLSDNISRKWSKYSS